VAPGTTAGIAIHGYHALVTGVVSEYAAFPHTPPVLIVHRGVHQGCFGQRSPSLDRGVYVQPTFNVTRIVVIYSSVAADNVRRLGTR
jgi:hypothetical protein